jgi:hypothetical protein
MRKSIKGRNTLFLYWDQRWNLLSKLHKRVYFSTHASCSKRFFLLGHIFSPVCDQGEQNDRRLIQASCCAENWQKERFSRVNLASIHHSSHVKKHTHTHTHTHTNLAGDYGSQFWAPLRKINCLRNCRFKYCAMSRLKCGDGQSCWWHI